MSKQPIHDTIKPKTQVERFELKWEMVEYLTSKNISVQAYGLSFIVGETHTTISNKIAEAAAVALEIILQCRTFSPGVFERKENGVWQRAGETQKHENTEGC